MIKKCSKCRKELEASEEFFFKAISKASPKLRADCKVCYMESLGPRKTQRKKGVRKTCAEYNRQYWANLCPAKRKIYNRKKYEKVKDNPEFKLLRNSRKRIWGALRGEYNKVEKTKALVGCDFSVLKVHLELQFKEGMTWDNYGQWHVDHIIPCASFDFSNLKEQKACFHYTNLQPMWAAENIKKGDRVLC